MKNTIKAKNGYRVKKAKNIRTGEEVCAILDGVDILFVAYERTYDDYKEEERNNEMFNRCEIFTTVKGNQFIYWRDEELDADYVTKLTNEE